MLEFNSDDYLLGEEAHIDTRVLIMLFSNEKEISDIPSPCDFEEYEVSL